MTVSITRLVPEPLGLREGSYAVLAAVASNTLSKLLIGAAIGRGWFAVDVAMMSLACAGAALAALWLTLLLAPVG